MSPRRIIIGTRGSDLARKQTEIVSALLVAAHPGLEIGIKIISTEGDRNQRPIPLDTVGKRLFTKDIEDALLAAEIDLAVHSLKDLPAVFPDGLMLGAVPARADARDVLVSKSGAKLSQLPPGAIIGTDSSLRKSLVLNYRPDLVVKSIRGNVPTRVEKLHREDYDALILAAAGLSRLGMESVITEYFDTTEMVPAPGQGALAVESRRGDVRCAALLAPLADAAVTRAVAAERAFSIRLGGGCKTPIGAFASCDGKKLSLYGCVGSIDGGRIQRGGIEGDAARPEEAGALLAERLAAEASASGIELPSGARI